MKHVPASSGDVPAGIARLTAADAGFRYDEPPAAPTLGRRQFKPQTTAVVRPRQADMFVGGLSDSNLEPSDIARQLGATVCGAQSEQCLWADYGPLLPEARGAIAGAIGGQADEETTGQRRSR